jgi:hypothetical protein
MVDSTLPVVLNVLDVVIGAPEYVVAVPLVITSLLDFVQCCRRNEATKPDCAFLGATVLGIDPMEIDNEVSG